MNVRLLHGDCLELLATLPAESIDACVTDPPYGIGFMGKEWDTFKPGYRADNWQGYEHQPKTTAALHAGKYDRSTAANLQFQEWTKGWAREVLRVLKPGAHILVCGAPRSYHRMACGLEDAGFEIRDCLAWLFSTGFPKSLNLGCKCGGNAIPYSHAGLSTPERDVRPLFGADVSPAINAGDESRQVLLDGLPKQGASERGAEGTESEVGGGEQSRLEWRELHRAGEGLPHDPDTGAPARAAERVRAGAHRDRGEDSRPAPEASGGSASQGSGSGEQRSWKSANLRLPSRTLDSRASERRSRCERCGGLTEARGLGTALKPAHEPIVLARKPFRGTVAANVLRHGTGALNIDACRIGDTVETWPKTASYGRFDPGSPIKINAQPTGPAPAGRWPANVVLDEIAALVLDEQSGQLVSGSRSGERHTDKTRNVYGTFQGTKSEEGHEGSIGGASRFYYIAKPSREERDYGTRGLPRKDNCDISGRTPAGAGLNSPRAGAMRTSAAGNHHPTVKPVELMRWLVKLVVPVGGTCIDPFLGSGTTGMACRYELRDFIGIERELEYLDIARCRIAAVAPLFAESPA